MKYLKTYESYDGASIADEVYFIMVDLVEQLQFKVEITFWVNGAIGGYLLSDEKGVQRYGPIANDGKLYLKVEVKKIEPPGNFLTKDGFNWMEAKDHFDRLRIFLQRHSSVKYKIKSMVFSYVPRFSIMKEPDMNDTYQTSFDYADSKYMEKDFTDRYTLTSVSYFFERL